MISSSYLQLVKHGALLTVVHVRKKHGTRSLRNVSQEDIDSNVLLLVPHHMPLTLVQAIVRPRLWTSHHRCDGWCDAISLWVVQTRS